MKNRNRVFANLALTPGQYRLFVSANADNTQIFDLAHNAMGRTAVERGRRVFGRPRFIEADDQQDPVVVYFEADTEPS